MVSSDIGWMLCIYLTLQCRVFVANLPVAPQIGAKRQVPFDLRISLLENVHVMRSILSPIFCEVAPPRNSILTPFFVRGFFKLQRVIVDARNVSDDRKQINNRL